MNDVVGPTPPAKETRNSIEDIWGARTPFDGEGRWPERIDTRIIGAVERWVQSACVLCSNGCALDIGVAGNRIVGVPRPRCRPGQPRALGPERPAGLGSKSQFRSADAAVDTQRGHPALPSSSSSTQTWRTLSSRNCQIFKTFFKQ
jgi:hypothetical protein